MSPKEGVRGDFQVSILFSGTEIVIEPYLVKFFYLLSSLFLPSGAEIINYGWEEVESPRKLFFSRDVAFSKIFITGKISVKADIEFHNPFSRALLVFRLPQSIQEFSKKFQRN